MDRDERLFKSLLGLILFISGVAFGLYASQRNCLIEFLTTGHMNYWTVLEILGGFVSVIEIFVILIYLRKKQNVI